ncbi:hypothetical protein AAY473_022934 [Plecturocebus cupreus]
MQPAKRSACHTGCGRYLGVRRTTNILRQKGEKHLKQFQDRPGVVLAKVKRVLLAPALQALAEPILPTQGEVVGLRRALGTGHSLPTLVLQECSTTLKRRGSCSRGTFTIFPGNKAGEEEILLCPLGWSAVMRSTAHCSINLLAQGFLPLQPPEKLGLQLMELVIEVDKPLDHLHPFITKSGEQTQVLTVGCDTSRGQERAARELLQLLKQPLAPSVHSGTADPAGSHYTSMLGQGKHSCQDPPNHWTIQSATEADTMGPEIPTQGVAQMSDPLTESRSVAKSWSAVVQSRLTATSTSQVQAILLPQLPGFTGACHYAQLTFVFLVQTWFHYVGQGGLKLLTL